MSLEKEPFKTYILDEDKEETGEIISLRLSKEERQLLDSDKQIIEQLKDSTAIKQLWKVGSKVIHDTKTKEILSIILGNERRNKRLGVAEFD